MYSHLRSGEKLKDELVFAMLDRTRARQRCKNNPRVLANAMTL